MMIIKKEKKNNIPTNNKKEYASLHLKTNDKHLETKITENDFRYKDLNDQELNNLEYKAAIILDKRNYFQYYWSLIKKKQLLFFTFYPIKDYNLVTIKICLFLLSFSLYFTINGFFYSDDTMHKIYEDNGASSIIYRIPQIINNYLFNEIISCKILDFNYIQCPIRLYDAHSFFVLKIMNKRMRIRQIQYILLLFLQ